MSDIAFDPSLRNVSLNDIAIEVGFDILTEFCLVAVMINTL
jgi:hypothetical protein